MLVREVTEKDIPQIIHLGGRMHEESQYNVLDYAPEKVANVCYQIIDNDNMLGLVVVHETKIVGMFSAYVDEFLYGSDLVAKDTLLYITPEHRGGMAFIKIMNEYQNWAFLNGAKMVFASQTSGIEVDKTSYLYSRLGFERVGGTFAKVML